MASTSASSLAATGRFTGKTSCAGTVPSTARARHRRLPSHRPAVRSLPAPSLFEVDWPPHIFIFTFFIRCLFDAFWRLWAYFMPIFDATFTFIRFFFFFSFFFSLHFTHQIIIFLLGTALWLGQFLGFGGNGAYPFRNESLIYRRFGGWGDKAYWRKRPYLGRMLCETHTSMTKMYCRYKDCVL